MSELDELRAQLMALRQELLASQARINALGEQLYTIDQAKLPRSTAGHDGMAGVGGWYFSDKPYGGLIAVGPGDTFNDEDGTGTAQVIIPNNPALVNTQWNGSVYPADWFNIPILSGAQFVNNSDDGTPGSRPGSIYWKSFTLTYQGARYAIAAGSTTSRFVWWNLNTSGTALQTGPSAPDLDTDQFLITLNNGGTALPALFQNIVYADYIEAGAISTDKIATGAVTADQIAANTITAAQIAAGTITGTQIATNTITAANIAADTITANEIAAGAIGTNELAANAVVAGKIAAGAITADKLTVGIGGGNLCQDGSFELRQDTFGARTPNITQSYVTLDGDDLASPFSNTMVSLNWLADGTSQIWMDQAVPVLAGQKIIVSFWYKAATAGSLTGGNLIAYWSNATTTNGLYTIQADHAWHRQILTYTVPAGVTSVRLIWTQTASGSWWYDIDQLQVEYGDVATAWKPNNLGGVIIEGSKILAGTPGAARVEMSSGGVFQYDSGNNVVARLYADGTPPLMLMANKLCDVTNSSVQSIPDLTWRTINFDTDTDDADDWHNTITNNSRITVPSNGRYLVIGQVALAANNTGSRGARILRNGSAIRVMVTGNAGSNDTYITIVATKKCSANDYFELQAFQASGAGLNTLAGSAFTALSVVRLW